MISKLEDMDVYLSSLELAMEVFALTKQFPAPELYSLCSQLNRAARSVSLNIAEGWGRRFYPNETKKAFIYALGSTEETIAALKISMDCGYISLEKYEVLQGSYRKIAAQLYRLYKNW
ncbi:MAG: four helix bundle protein [Flavipsychrobacter sp.]|jgi:four helix bundle protein|nr:four helix bundle protein [Flavipsychrobacter sp.]